MPESLRTNNLIAVLSSRSSTLLALLWSPLAVVVSWDAIIVPVIPVVIFFHIFHITLLFIKGPSSRR